jgi:GNAT superfamily N-acetyltransferase
MSSIDHRRSFSATLVPDRTLKQSDARVLRTRSGLSLRLRSVTMEDALHLEKLLSHLGEGELGFRFLTGTDRFKPHQIVEMLAIDHRRAEHQLAFVDAKSEPVAGLLVGSDNAMQLVEVAIIVDRDWHGRGIGSILLRHAVGLARERGFKGIRSIESVANCAALQIERAAGFVVRPYGSASGLVFAEARLG